MGSDIIVILSVVHEAMFDVGGLVLNVLVCFPCFTCGRIGGEEGHVFTRDVPVCVLPAESISNRRY